VPAPLITLTPQFKVAPLFTCSGPALQLFTQRRSAALKVIIIEVEPRLDRVAAAPVTKVEVEGVNVPLQPRGAGAVKASCAGGIERWCRRPPSAHPPDGHISSPRDVCHDSRNPSMHITVPNIALRITPGADKY